MFRDEFPKEGPDPSKSGYGRENPQHRQYRNGEFLWAIAGLSKSQATHRREAGISQFSASDSKTEAAIQAGGELQQLKESIFKLYETFTKIEINTERLQQAKVYFEQGQFREADAILKAAEMNADLDQLLERQEQLQTEQAKIEASKEQIADEFLIKARL